MDKPFLLVIEDDAAVRKLIAMTLELQGYAFQTAATGREGLEIAAARLPDILLLDLGLPDLDGVEIIRKLRGWSNLPILVISARSDDKDKIEALDAGADDYITKPFSVEEMLARIRAAIRRLGALQPVQEAAVFVDGDLRIDYTAGCAYVRGEEVHLTPIEYKLLVLLAKNAGRVLTHAYILKEVWGSALPSDVASLRVFMVTLRKKLETGQEARPYIQTHVGIGYRLIRYE